MDVEDDLQEDRDRLTVRLNSIINSLAGRDDLLLTCVWNRQTVAGQPKAPAWFTPKTNTVTINATVALGGAAPGGVNPLTPSGRRKHPEIIGLCAHEASHAHSTQWGDTLGQGYPQGVVKAAVALEEPRIEHRQLQRRPQDRPYLRAQSMLLDLAPFQPGSMSDRKRGANAALMIMARADAGVLEPEDAMPVVSTVRNLLGTADLRALRSLWREAIGLPDGDVDSLLDVARRWVDVVGEPPAEDEPAYGCCAPASGAQPDATPTNDDEWDDPDSHDEDGTDEFESDGIDPLMTALESAVSTAHDEATAEIDIDVPRSDVAPKDVATQKQREKDIKAQNSAASRTKRIFHGYSAGNRERVLGTPRTPTPHEQRLARQIGEALRRAQFRERTTVQYRSMLPPGRLDGRDAMLGAAQRSMGSMVTAKPFTTLRRRHVPEPPMRMGIMIDVSGSMTWAEDIMATTAWAFAHAATYVHGQTASVAFGETVTPITRPGTPPSKVTPFAANSGWENFKDGFAAIDGALDLTTGRGVRLLIVVSDGHYGGAGQSAAAAESVARLARNGGYALWIDTSNRAIVPEGALPVVVGGDVTTIPAAITAALTAALRA